MQVHLDDNELDYVEQLTEFRTNRPDRAATLRAEGKTVRQAHLGGAMTEVAVSIMFPGSRISGDDPLWEPDRSDVVLPDGRTIEVKSIEVFSSRLRGYCWIMQPSYVEKHGPYLTADIGVLALWGKPLGNWVDVAGWFDVLRWETVGTYGLIQGMEGHGERYYMKWEQLWDIQSLIDPTLPRVCLK